MCAVSHFPDYQSIGRSLPLLLALFYFYERWCQPVALTDLELKTTLPQTPKCWGCGHVQPWPANLCSLHKAPGKASTVNNVSKSVRFHSLCIFNAKACSQQALVPAFTFGNLQFAFKKIFKMDEC